MTLTEMDNAIKSAYEYAHLHCVYAPTDRSYPPMEDGKADCCALVFRALYTLNINKRARNINDIPRVCEMANMIKTTNINDVWKKHCVVCMCPKNDPTNIAHVYYSLGGKSLNDIDKYDLGNDDRIASLQPFPHVNVNEWQGKYSFLCAYYTDTKYKPCNDLGLTNGVTGTVIADTGLYAGAGTKWDKIAQVPKNTKCVIYPVLVTNTNNNTFRAVRLFDGTQGYIYHASVVPDSFTEYRAEIYGTDGTLNVRAGVGLDKPIIGKLNEFDIVRIKSVFWDTSKIEWCNVETHTLCGFVTKTHLKKLEK